MNATVWTQLLAVPFAPAASRSVEKYALLMRPNMLDGADEATQDLWDAVDANNPARVLAALTQGADVNWVLGQHCLVLQAIDRGFWEVARVLREQGNAGFSLEDLDGALPRLLRRDDVAELLRVREWGVDPAQLELDNFIQDPHCLQWWLEQDPVRVPQLLTLSPSSRYFREWMLSALRGTEQLRTLFNQAWGLDGTDPQAFLSHAMIHRCELGPREAWTRGDVWESIFQQDDPALVVVALQSGWGTPDDLEGDPCWHAAKKDAWQLFDWLIQVPALQDAMRELGLREPGITWIPVAARSVEAVARMDQLGFDFETPTVVGTTPAHEILRMNFNVRAAKEVLAWMVAHRPELLFLHDTDGQTPLDKAGINPSDQGAIFAQAQANKLRQDTTRAIGPGSKRRL